MKPLQHKKHTLAKRGLSLLCILALCLGLLPVTAWADQSLEGAKIEINGSYTFNGREQTPDGQEVTVTLEGKLLEEDIDYYLVYDNNIKAGSATVTAIGKGDYSGEASGTFVIHPATVQISMPDPAAFNGKPIVGETSSITVQINGTVDGYNAEGTLELYVDGELNGNNVIGGKHADSQPVVNNQATLSWVAEVSAHSYQVIYIPKADTNYKEASAYEVYFSGPVCYAFEDQTVTYGESCELHCILLDEFGNPKVSAEVELSVKDISLGKAISDEKGMVAVPFQTTSKLLSVGTHTVTASYYYDDGKTVQDNFELVIKPATATLDGVMTAQDRQFDGTTDVAIQGGRLQGVRSEDEVDFEVCGVLADANVGNEKSVSVLGELTGKDKSYYTLTQPSDLVVDISPADTTLSLQMSDNNIIAGNKVSIVASVNDVIDGFDAEGTIELLVDDESIGSKLVSDNQAIFEWTASYGQHTISAFFTPSVDGNYKSSETIETKKLVKPIEVEAVPEKTVGDEPFQLKVSGGEEPYTYTVTSGDAVTVDNDGMVSVVKEGTAQITISSDGEDLFNPVLATIYITVRAQATSSGGNVAMTVSEKTIDAVQDAQPGDTVTVDFSRSSTKLDKEVFEELRGQDITLVIELGDGLSWTINGSDIPENAKLADIDLGVTMNSDGIPVDIINAITGEHGSIQLELDHNGAFGFTMTLSAPLGTENAGYWANLYHFDEDTNKMSFETAAKINSDGTASLSFSHASQYAIVIDDHNHGVITLPFTDVQEGDWFYDPVCFVYSQGLMTGTSATTFEPNTSLSRAMLVAVLHRLEGSPAASGGNFSDVASGDWYAEAVNWAASVGVVNGMGDGSFQPNAAITREQMAAILRNYAAYKGMDVSTSGDLSAYSDAASVSDWAQDSVAWAVDQGLLSGMTVDTLQPQGLSTRAQVAAVLQRYLAK